MRGLLEDCIKTAKTANEVDFANLPERQSLVEGKLAAARKKVGALFGFESFAKPLLDAKIKELMLERKRLELLKTYGDYPCLSQEALAWRDKEGWPKLALLGLDSPHCQIMCQATQRRDWDGPSRMVYANKMLPNIPPKLRMFYQDVFNALAVIAREEKKTAQIATSYVGFIPDPIRAKIIKAQQDFHQVYLLAEAGTWKVTKTAARVVPRPNRGDPLVLGWDGDNLWIVAAFDLTPIERMIKTEFTI